MDISLHLEKIRLEIQKIPTFDKYAKIIHKKTHVAPEVLLVLLGTIPVIMLFFDIFAGTICDIFAYGYPLYQTLNSINSGSHEDHTQWLIYWVVFGLFSCFEAFISIITYWIPFYYPLKLSFLIWCMHPTYKGSTFLYTNYIREMVLANIPHVDNAINQVDPSKILSAAVSAASSTMNSVKEENHID